MTSKKQLESVRKYTEENYDQLRILLPKGMKEQIISHAKKMGDLDVKPRRDGSVFSRPSINAFVKRAIRETIERDLKKMSE